MARSMFKLKQLKIVALLLMSYAVSFNGNCYAQEWVPADFRDKAQSILGRVNLSKRELGGVLVINGGAEMNRSGKLTSVSIYSNPSRNKKFGFFERAVQSALEGRHFEAAKIDGKKKGVWLNFTVIFEYTGKETKVLVFPSLLAHTDKYGTEYSDPQRNITKKFPAVCAEIGKIKGSILWVAAEIDSAGKQLSAEVIAGDATSQCKRELIEDMGESIYIPAIASGKPVDAKYIEAFYTHSKTP